MLVLQCEASKWSCGPAGAVDQLGGATVLCPPFAAKDDVGKRNAQEDW